MIRKIHIQNFKSIYDLEFEVGRINLFIGENGSGKSNLLEALVFISASNADKLDNEFLTSRGIRVTAPELMKSAFDEESKDKSIKIDISHNDDEYVKTELVNNTSNYSKWEKVELNPKKKYKIKEIQDAFKNLEENLEEYSNDKIKNMLMRLDDKELHSLAEATTKIMNLNYSYIIPKIRMFYMKNKLQ